jgi:hypothetical protein
MDKFYDFTNPNYVLHGKIRVDRQAENPFGDPPRGQEGIFQRDVPVAREVAQKRIEVATRKDVVCFQGIVKRITAHAEWLLIDLDRLEDEVVIDPRGKRRWKPDAGNILEALPIRCVDSP